MLVECYEMIFRVTETLQNGNERTFKKSVYSPIFRNGHHLIELDRIQKATAELESLHYYNIQHVETKKKTFITTGNLEGVEI